MTRACANDSVYIWRTGVFSDGIPIYKIGKTSARRNGNRIKVVAGRWKFIAVIIKLVETSIEASVVEAMLMQIGRLADMSQYDGYRRDGEKEFRVMTDEELTQAMDIVVKHTKVPELLVV
jgi:hypothetical protein